MQERMMGDGGGVMNELNWKFEDLWEKISKATEKKNANFRKFSTKPLVRIARLLRQMVLEKKIEKQENNARTKHL